ncbi:MAG: hypothetical protein KAR42_03215 [candidate division Zixibacteria bacterium]|nr:hypothetical protein [candidate division Zixibacteria bacterium]
MKCFLSIAIILVAMVATVGADIAPLVNYQGRLTDSNGDVVADGWTYMTFGIYASEGAPSPIWTSGARDVYVKDGLFSYILGSTAALPHNIFDNQLRWLGIKVATDAEISPRTRFTAVPYSYRALKADTAEYIATADDFVHTIGDTMTNDLVFDGDSDGNYEGTISVSTSSANIYLRSSDTTTVRLYGASYGELALYYGFTGGRRAVLAGLSSGGRLRLYDGNNDQQIEIDAGDDGNSSVVFPEGAIDADEILNEPGIVSNTGDSPYLTSASFVDIATATISTPGAGYVYVSGHCSIIFSGSTDLSGAYLQIDTTEGGGNEGEDVFVFKSTFHDTETNSSHAFVDRVYYISSARTITFRLEAARYSQSTGTVRASRSRIKAMYFPTSYGSVKTLVSDPGEFTNAEMVTTKDGLGNSKTEYKVDLRDLEVKAKEAKIRALEAELELEKAREAAERN